MRFLFKWIEDRTAIGKLTREALFENIPGGARWRYVWGSTLTFAIMVQFVTGMVLWMFYSPSATSAWESVNYLQQEVTGGAWLRGIHHWTAQFMIVLLVLHLVQVVIDGAYKAPREFNFWFGLALLGITLALGLTGYLLPWDQKGYWATEVATNILAAVPVIGDQLKQIVVGGSEYGHHTLTRFFALHAGVLPVALILLIVVHIYLFRKQGITPAPPKTASATRHFWWLAVIVLGFAQGLLIWNWKYVPNPMGLIIGALFAISVLRLLFLYIRRGRIEEENSKKPRRGDAYFWPDQIFRDAVACAAVLGAILFFVWNFGTHLSAPADPSEAYAAARPDWYFMSLFYLLKKVDLVTGAFVIPSAIALYFVLMPFIGRVRFGHWLNLGVLTAVLAGFMVFTLLGFRDDWEDPEFNAAVARAKVEAERIQVLAISPDRIPPEGALSLLRRDPLTQGPKLFAEHCASCHAYDGHDGLGRPRPDKQIAPDLHGFGDRTWAAAMLDYEKYGSEKYFGGTALIRRSKMHRFLRSDMTDLDEVGEKEREMMVMALSAEAKLKSQAEIDLRDAELIKEGRVLMGEDGFFCVDCHTYNGEGERGVDLNGYASREWQIEFIKNPEHERFYGSRNDKMPIFGPRQ